MITKLLAKHDFMYVKRTISMNYPWSAMKKQRRRITCSLDFQSVQRHREHRQTLHSSQTILTITAAAGWHCYSDSKLTLFMAWHRML